MDGAGGKFQGQAKLEPFLNPRFKEIHFQV